MTETKETTPKSAIGVVETYDFKGLVPTTRQFTWGKRKIWGVEKSLPIPQADSLKLALFERRPDYPGLTPEIACDEVRQPFVVWLYNPDYKAGSLFHSKEPRTVVERNSFLLFRFTFNTAHDTYKKIFVRCFAYDTQTHSFRQTNNMGAREREVRISSDTSLPNQQSFIEKLKASVLTSKEPFGDLPTGEELERLTETFDPHANRENIQDFVSDPTFPHNLGHITTGVIDHG